MDIFKMKHIYMIGIGGISMSGIAQILKKGGVNVYGSDIYESEITKNLVNCGIPVTIGHNIENLKTADLVVYTAAIQHSDIELLKAKDLNIPIIERADFLGEITKLYKNTIAISGTHGKTTTTSMISLCFMEAGLDPTIQVGAILKNINANYRVGNSDYFIIEACEYVESFLKFHPKTEIILNIDNDHLDYFKNLENIKNAFIKYIKLLPEDGLLVINNDDINCLDVIKYCNSKVITYSINSESDFKAENIIFNKNGFASFDVYYKKEFYDSFELSIIGEHNIFNALACIATCHEYNIEKEHIKNAVLKFTGANRRFEFIKDFNNISVFDDYAHHPTEITALFDSLKNKKYNKNWIIFQPHTFSRTHALLKEFGETLSKFDNVIVTDIYAAREKNEYNIYSTDLVKEINSNNNNSIFISEFSDIIDYIKNNAKENDVVITVGAGTITNLGKML